MIGNGLLGPPVNRQYDIIARSGPHRAFCTDIIVLFYQNVFLIVNRIFDARISYVFMKLKLDREKITKFALKTRGQ